MAMIFEGKSTCPLCGEILDNTRKMVLFPNFTSNIKEPLFIFSDSGIHLDCLNKNALMEKAIFFKEMYYDNIPSPKSRCIVDDNLITDPKNILAFGLLTSNENENLYKFNFLTLNKKNTQKWKDKHKFIEAALEFKKRDKWLKYSEFNYLEYLISGLSDF